MPTLVSVVERARISVAAITSIRTSLVSPVKRAMNYRAVRSIRGSEPVPGHCHRRAVQVAVAAAVVPVPGVLPEQEAEPPGLVPEAELPVRAAEHPARVPEVDLPVRVAELRGRVREPELELPGLALPAGGSMWPASSPQ